MTLFFVTILESIAILALATTFALHLLWFHRPPKQAGCTKACSEGHTYTWPCEQALLGKDRHGAR